VLEGWPQDLTKGADELFTTSAVVGFTRTAACSSSGLEHFQTALPRALPSSSFPWVPERRCPAVGDVPRMCSSLVLSGGEAVSH
jgi:hypothetical protein